MDASASSPALGKDGTIYTGSEDTGTLYVITSEGKIKWTGKFGGHSVALGSSGKIYSTSYSGFLSALSLASITV